MTGICDQINVTAGQPAFAPPAAPAIPSLTSASIENDIYWLKIAAILEKFTYVYVRWLLTEVKPDLPTRPGDSKTYSVLNQTSFKPFFDFLVGTDSPLEAADKQRLITLRTDGATKPEAFRTFLREKLGAGGTPTKHAVASAILEGFTQSYIRALLTEIKPDTTSATPRVGYPEAYAALTKPSFKPFFEYLKGDQTPLSINAKAALVSQTVIDKETAAQKTLAQWEAELAQRKQPAQVTSLTVGAVAGNSAPVNWAAAARAAQYALITWDNTNRAATCAEVDAAGANSYTLTGLPANASRSVAIVAKNDAGYGPVSDPATVTTVEDTPGPVRDLKLAIKGKSLIVSWKRPNSGKDPSKYHVLVFPKAEYRKDFDKAKPGIQYAPPVPPAAATPDLPPIYVAMVKDVDGQADFSYSFVVDEEKEYAVEVYAEGSPFGPPKYEEIDVPNATDGTALLYRANYRTSEALRGMPYHEWIWPALIPEAAGFSLVPYTQTFLQSDSAIIPSTGEDVGTGGSAWAYWATHEQENRYIPIPDGFAFQLHSEYLGRFEPVEIYADGTTHVGHVGGSLSAVGEEVDALGFGFGLRIDRRFRGTTSDVHYPVHQFRPNFFSDADGWDGRIDLLIDPAITHKYLPQKWLNLVFDFNARIATEDVDAAPPSLYASVPERTNMLTILGMGRLRADTHWGGFWSDRLRTVGEFYLGGTDLDHEAIVPNGNTGLGMPGPSGTTELPGMNMKAKQFIWGATLSASVDLNNNFKYGWWNKSFEASAYHGEEQNDNRVPHTQGQGVAATWRIGSDEGTLDISGALSRTARMLSLPRIEEESRTLSLRWNLPPSWLSGMPGSIFGSFSRTDLTARFPEGVDPYRDPATETNTSLLFGLQLGFGTPAHEDLAARQRTFFNPNLP